MEQRIVKGAQEPDDQRYPAVPNMADPDLHVTEPAKATGDRFYRLGQSLTFGVCAILVGGVLLVLASGVGRIAWWAWSWTR